MVNASIPVSTSVPSRPPFIISTTPLPMKIKTNPSSLADPPLATARPFLGQAALCQNPAFCERVPLVRARTEEEIVALARKHLAGWLGTPIDQVEIISVEKVWWEDDTLGCPRPPGNYPDRAYPEPIPGYRILFAVKGVQYEYRSGRLWLLFCVTPLPTEIK